MLEFMSSEAVPDKEFNEAMAEMEAKLEAQGILVEAPCAEEAPAVEEARQSGRV